MEKQANKHQREPDFDVRDSVWVTTKNQKTERPSCKLDYQIASPYKVLKKVGNSYEVDLPKTIRVHPIFSPDKLQKALGDLLPKQNNDLSLLIQVNSNDKWEVEEILASKLLREALHYQVKWTGYDSDPTWYPTWNFVGCPQKLQEFHNDYLEQLGPPKYLNEQIDCQHGNNEPTRYCNRNALKA